MLTLHLCSTLNCLSVSDLLWNHIHRYAISLLELCPDDADLNVSLAAQQGLVGFGISFQYERRVFLHELVEALSHFLFVLLVRSLHGDEVVRLWELDSRKLYCFALQAKGVAGLGVLKLCQREHVACRNLCRCLLMLAPNEEHGSQLLALLGTRVIQFLSQLHGAGQNLCIGDFPHERIGDGLEHV